MFTIVLHKAFDGIQIERLELNVDSREVRRSIKLERGFLT